MAYIDWTEDFSVKVKEIDDQHKRLIEMINTLHDAHIAKKGKDVYKDILDGMISYALTHFATEEKYMQEFGYKDYDIHKAEHDHFAEKAKDLLDQFNQTGFAFSLTLLNFLRDWLKIHIMGTDKKYMPSFQEHGLS